MSFVVHCIVILAVVLAAGCSAEAPSVTIASARGPSCQTLDDISTTHKAKVETAASATYQLVEAGARSDIGSEAAVRITFTEQPKDACSSIQRTATCFAGLAQTTAERTGVQNIWAPIIESICASPTSAPRPDFVIPPSASARVVPP